MIKQLIIISIFFFASIDGIAQVNANSILSKKNYPKTKPNITFCGKSEGAIMVDSLLLNPSLHSYPPYTINSASVHFGGGNFINPIIAGFMGNSSSSKNEYVTLSALNNEFKRCTVGTKITFINIKIKKDNIIYDAPDMKFIVKEKL